MTWRRPSVAMTELRPDRFLCPWKLSSLREEISRCMQSRMTLRQFFDGLDEKPYIWAKRHGISKSIVYNLLAGKRARWESVKRVSEATAGAVTIQEIMA